MALGGVLPQQDPESTENCVHGVPVEVECVHCLLAYCDFEFQQLMKYTKFLEKFLETLLGEDWRNIAIEEVKRLPNLPLRITSHV